MNLQESIRRILREESDLYDNPRKVVKQHNDYDLIVDKISSLKDPNKIKNIIEDWILDNEEYFADLIFDSEGEEYINCEHAAEMVSQILSDSNKKHKLQVGNIKKQSHAWVNYDGVIIDPTKSQFPGIEHNDYLEDIYWEKENMNLQESIRRILREEMNKEVKWLLRKLGDPDVMDDLDATVISTAMFTNACGKTEYDFFDEVMENSVHNFINHWEQLYEADDFLPIDDFVYRLIHEKYEDYIIGKYQSKIAKCS